MLDMAKLPLKQILIVKKTKTTKQMMSKHLLVNIYDIKFNVNGDMKYIVKEHFNFSSHFIS